jgi:hypothetical protein
MTDASRRGDEGADLGQASQETPLAARALLGEELWRRKINESRTDSTKAE